MRRHSARIRLRAFTDWMAERGLEGPADWMQEGNHRVEGGRDAMRRLLAATAVGVRPSAVMGSNDLTAIGMLGAIHEAGLKVPGDLSLVGYDDIQLSEYTQPALTTLRLSRTEIATAAFRALFKARRAAGADAREGEDHVIMPVLVVRESTGRLD